MNREIKFRGKDVDTNQWVYGSLMVYNKHQPTITWVNDTGPIEKKHTCVVYPDSVGEYKGLHDKNTQEIYEGDIVNYTFSDGESIKLVCIWDEEYSCIEFRSSIGINQFWRFPKCQEHQLEVIGNVYDNPELKKLLDEEIIKIFENK